MNWAWASSLDQLWRSPSFPLWLTVAAACFFGLIVLFTLLRADKSIANGALTVIALLAIGVALAATARAFTPSGRESGDSSIASFDTMATLPALACIDDMAGEPVLAACEKVLFGSPDAVAAGVSYAAARIARLMSFGDVADANARMTPSLQALRRSIERDRYGLVAYVLTSLDHCQPSDCAFFKSVIDHNQIAANMEEHIYEGLVDQHKASWSEPVTAAAVAPQTVPSGKPTTADFPTAASIPPVNIMTPEPPAPAPAPATVASPPTAAQASTHSTKRTSTKPRPRPAPVRSGPVQLTPGAANN